jgi:hypothetical protein
MRPRVNLLSAGRYLQYPMEVEEGRYSRCGVDRRSAEEEKSHEKSRDNLYVTYSTVPPVHLHAQEMREPQQGRDHRPDTIVQYIDKYQSNKDSLSTLLYNIRSGPVLAKKGASQGCQTLDSIVQIEDLAQYNAIASNLHKLINLTILLYRPHPIFIVPKLQLKYNAVLFN